MDVTLEIIVDSIKAYREVLGVLKLAQDKGELACDFRARPSKDSIAPIIEAELPERSDTDVY